MLLALIERVFCGHEVCVSLLGISEREREDQVVGRSETLEYS